MSETTYRNRRAVRLENDTVRVTVMVEGGHIAEILHKPSSINPLWTPPWPSIEPSTYNEAAHPEYGRNAESRLLAGIMGHNVCVDLFGGPSPEEARAGVSVHGEASILPYRITLANGVMACRCDMPMSQLVFERRISLDGGRVAIEESIENLTPWDRSIAWTQHVTLGPPFLERGKTRFELTATRSRTYDGDFGELFPRAVEFQWPMAPLRGGGEYDLRVFSDREESAGFTTHLLDPSKDHALWAAWSADGQIVFGYRWKREDFPWLGIWEENCARKSPPWNGVTITRGMEFGVSPQAETRRAMIDRGQTFGVPGFRWLLARSKVSASYEAFIGPAASMPLIN
jgi:hypothetical protein